MKKADELLDYLLREEGLTLSQADSIAYGESKPSPLLKRVLALAPFEWKRGVLLLLLTYRYQSLGRVKRILGYSRTYTQRLNKNFLRNLLMKWADKFFLQKITAFSVMNMLNYQKEMRAGRNINTFSCLLYTSDAADE